MKQFLCRSRQTCPEYPPKGIYNHDIAIRLEPLDGQLLDVHRGLAGSLASVLLPSSSVALAFNASRV